MGPVDSLKQAVAEGRLQPDPGQAEIAEHLEALCDALAEWNEGKSGLFSKSRPAPRGLYLYGGVGTGKSLMMDLFFDAAPVAKKRRVHFHQFLQEIQARITHEREKKDSDPLPRVAKALAK